MEQAIVHWVDPNELNHSAHVQGFFSEPDNYELIKENIRNVGILTPLHVVDKIVVSGNLRLKIAQELKMNSVPVIYVPRSDIKEDVLTVSYSQQREKKYSEILAEYEILERDYPISKGSRTDLDPEKKRKSNMRKSINISSSKLNKLRNIKSLAIEMFGFESERYKNIWSDLDSGRVRLDRAYKSLKNEKKRTENKDVLPGEFSIELADVKIYNKSCANLNELEAESISCIICSPPYFQMRDYGTGESQRGLEKDILSYVDGLMNDFKDCTRVLKKNGSLWVNISEPAIDGQYNSIPHRFAIQMMNNGWILNDEIIWVRNNPVFTQANRSVRAHEYIFHFVRSKNFQYNTSWLENVKDPDDLITYGSSAKVCNLLSSMDFRGNILRTNANRMEDLRKACNEFGFHLTHNAGFPISIPLIVILSSTKIGDTVLDIYSGTGTSGEAALSCGRKYIGYEIKSEFALTSAVRMRKHIDESIITNALSSKAA